MLCAMCLDQVQWCARQHEGGMHDHAGNPSVKQATRAAVVCWAESAPHLTRVVPTMLQGTNTSADPGAEATAGRKRGLADEKVSILGANLAFGCHCMGSWTASRYRCMPGCLQH